MQTAGAAPIDVSLPLAVSHPPILDPRRRTERPPATGPWTAALAGLIVLGQSLAGRALVGIALVVIASVGASRRMGEAPLPG